MVVLANDSSEEALGQQSSVFGVEAEHDLVEIAGQDFRVDGLLFHILDYGGEKVCGVLGSSIQGAVGTEFGGSMKGPIELVQVFFPVQRGHREFVPHSLHPGEVGLYPYGAEGGNDEQRRRLEVDLVAEQLVQGGVKVGVVALELPTEMAFQVGVGKPAGNPLLEGEDIGVVQGDGRGMVDEGANVKKHLLGCLFLPELDVLPLGDELVGPHFSG